MARPKLMFWVPAARRWSKQYRGKPYAVSCQQLGVPETQEASRRAANEWWLKKKAELDAANPPKRIRPHPAQDHLDAINERLEWATSHAPGEVKQLRNQLEEGKRYTHPADPNELDFDREAFARMREFERLADVDLSHVDPSVIAEYFGRGRIWADRLDRQPVALVAGDATLRHHADQYLALQRKKKPGTYGNIRQHTNYFVDCPGVTTPGMPIESVTEDLWRKFFLHLANKVEKEELSIPTAASKLAGAKPFVRYLFEQDVIKTLPRNLDSKDLAFRLPTQAVKVPGIDTVKDVLAAADGRVKLYLLLMVNTGMQQTDIAELTPSEVDYELGTITRKRTKTEAKKGVPVVCYKLWKPTLELLEKEQSERDDFVLVSDRGTKLVVRGVDGAGKGTKKDLIQLAWKRWNGGKFKIQLKELRKLGASLLASHKEHGKYAPHFLGHAPTTVADKHYVAVSQTGFDAAVSWLGEQILGKEVV